MIAAAQKTERNRAAAQEMYRAAKARDVETFFSFIERVLIRDGKAVHLRIYLHDAASLVQPA